MLRHVPGKIMCTKGNIFQYICPVLHQTKKYMTDDDLGCVFFLIKQNKKNKVTGSMHSSTPLKSYAPVEIRT